MNLTCRLAIVATAYFLGASAAGAQVIDHSFQFDAIVDSPGIQVLDYRYGDCKISGARSDPDYIKEGRSLQSTSITGPMRRGDSLWVKWKMRTKDKIYEDTVDLRSRLPRNIEDHSVYFMVDGSQLYAYLISWDRLPKGTVSTMDPRKYRFKKMTQIYPDATKK